MNFLEYVGICSLGAVVIFIVIIVYIIISELLQDIVHIKNVEEE